MLLQQIECIRYSNNDDITQILSWLKDEKIELGSSFYSNRNLIIEGHENRNVIVYIDPIIIKPIAYIVYDKYFCPQIMNVKADKQKKGIGTKLLGYFTQIALKNGCTFLKLECTPITSIPFWEKMEFTTYKTGYGFDFNYYAYKFFNIPHDLPENGVPVEVLIKFYPEERKFNFDTKPISSFSPSAVHLGKTIYLSNRIHGFDHQSDLVVEILINRNSIYLGKAKHEKANEIGMSSINEAFYIDKINYIT